MNPWNEMTMMKAILIGSIIALASSTSSSSSSTSSSAPSWVASTPESATNPTPPSTTTPSSPPPPISRPPSPPPPPPPSPPQPLSRFSFPMRSKRSRFIFQGPILTLTLKDPFANNYHHNTIIERATSKHKTTHHDEEDDDDYDYGHGHGHGHGHDHDHGQSTNDSNSELDENNMRKTRRRNRKRNRNRPSFFWSRRNNPDGCYTNFLNIRSLSPMVLCSIRSISKPLPNYIPSLHATSITAGYQYDPTNSSSSRVRAAAATASASTSTSGSSSSSSSSSSTTTTPTPKPTFIEGELKFRKKFLDRFGGKRIGFPGAIELDIAPKYLIREKKALLVLKMGGDDGGGTGSTTTTMTTSSSGGGGTGSSSAADSGGYGCYALIRFARKRGKKYLEYIRGSYRMDLPFTAVGSISITPSYDFEKVDPTLNIVGKSSSGRTAAVLDWNWDHPKLTVIHALDHRNTISPEIALYDAKIIYNWNVALDSGAIKTRIDPSSALQVTWIDETVNGKWVTDVKLPLVGNPGPLAGDIRVRRQFMF